VRNRMIALLTALTVAGAVLFTGSPAHAGTTTTAGTYSGDNTVRIVENFLNAAAVGSVACGITDIVKKMKKFKGRGGLPAIAAFSGEISAKAAGTNATCKLAKQMALAAAWTAYVGSTNPQVWVEERVSTDVGTVTKTITYTYRIGSSPRSTQTFSGSVKMSRWQ
jgi:hypothetical protein